MSTTRRRSRSRNTDRRSRREVGTWLPKCGKVVWLTRSAAHRYAKVVTRRYGKATHPYRCSGCGLWHLTTTERQRRRPC